MHEPFGVSLFCDDIREEKFGKRTYVGVHNRILKITGGKPATLPRLCVVSHIVIPSSFVFDSFRHELILLGEAGEEMISMGAHDGPPPTPATEKAVRAIAGMEITPLELRDDCELRVRAIFGDLVVPMGALTVRFVEPEPSESEAS
ncbi:MAG: hypothetical protein EA385_13010 [Salinarimonadaceae bacterium]|nr:MAG: hypothetical protein EA385_13010 [Salinarimonadaceae bacterium]